MHCPNCKNEHTAIIVYGHCVDEHGFEYPYDHRVFEAGSSLPAWGNLNDEWPIRFCYKCREKFDYKPEEEAFCVSYKDAVRMSYEK